MSVGKTSSINEVKEANYANDGFEIHKLFSNQLVENAVVDFYNRLQMQAFKLGVTHEFMYKNYGDIIDPTALDSLVISVNEKNKRSLDFAVQELRECPAYYGLVTKEFLDVSSTILDCPQSLLKIHFDGILVNLPSNKQRLYRYHSEQHYYPYRKNFLNFWMPVVRSKTAQNGAMLIKHKGHTREYAFNEYSGFDKVEGTSTSEDNFFYQLEIPEQQLSSLSTLLVDLNIGQGLFFHGNMPHTSVMNKSDTPSYSLIARVYDYRKDLTLSDRTGIKLYGAGNGGFPGLRSVD